MTGLLRVPLWVYNFGPAGENGRTVSTLGHEVSALCNASPHHDRRRKTSKVGVGIEALGWGRLPRLDGQKVIHDTSTPGRANIAMYHAAGLRVVDVDWIRHTEAWDRTEHPGVHWKRQTLLVTLGGPDTSELTLFVGTHAPPITRPGTGSSVEARREWVDLMVDVFRNSDIPVVMLGDPNGLFDNVRDKLGNPKVSLHGTPVEATLTRGYYFDDAREDHRVNGVVMGSDHHRAHRARLRRRNG